MSEEELLGTLGIQYKAAKERYAQRSAQAVQFADMFSKLATALRNEHIEPASLQYFKTTAPTTDELERLFHEVNEAKMQMEHAKTQLAKLGLAVD